MIVGDGADRPAVEEPVGAKAPYVHVLGARNDLTGSGNRERLHAGRADVDADRQWFHGGTLSQPAEPAGVSAVWATGFGS